MITLQVGDLLTVPEEVCRNAGILNTGNLDARRAQFLQSKGVLRVNTVDPSGDLWGHFVDATDGRLLRSLNANPRGWYLNHTLVQQCAPRTPRVGDPMRIEDARVGMRVRRTRGPWEHDDPLMLWWEASHGEATITHLIGLGGIKVQYVQAPAQVSAYWDRHEREGWWSSQAQDWTPVVAPTVEEFDEPPFTGVIP